MREAPQTATTRREARQGAGEIQPVAAERGSRWHWMSFRGKLRLKPPGLGRSHANAECHCTRHETQDNIQVLDDGRRDGIRRLAMVVILPGWGGGGCLYEEC